MLEDKPEDKPDSAAVKAVVKTVRMLEYLAEQNRTGVTEIADATGMSKATAFRFLSTLEQLGYVQRTDVHGTYSLTLKLFDVAGVVRARQTKLDDARPVLEKLADATGETVHLATLEGDHLVYLDKIESRRALRVSMMSAVGRSAPLYCTGLGKVLIAGRPAEEREKMIRSIEFYRYTSRTITDTAQLAQELEYVSRVGYALDKEEHEIGVRCVAAPVHNGTGDVVAALSVSAPSVRLTDEMVEDYREYVVRAAGRLSEIVGSGSWVDQ